MTWTQVSYPAIFIGTTAERVDQLEECQIGARWFDETLQRWYIKDGAAAWVAELIGIDPLSLTAVTPSGAASQAYDVATTITRPANATPYSANDVVGGALDLGVLGPSAKSIILTDVELECDVAAVPTGQNFALVLYSVTPPSAIADNAAWDVAAGDRASFLDYITLGVVADLGSTLYARFPNLNRQIRLAGTHLFAYLITPAGFTPAGNSEVYKLTIHTLAV